MARVASAVPYPCFLLHEWNAFSWGWECSSMERNIGTDRKLMTDFNLTQWKSLRFFDISALETGRQRGCGLCLSWRNPPKELWELSPPHKIPHLWSSTRINSISSAIQHPHATTWWTGQTTWTQAQAMWRLHTALPIFHHILPHHNQGFEGMVQSALIEGIHPHLASSLCSLGMFLDYLLTLNSHIQHLQLTFSIIANWLGDSIPSW